METCLPHPYFEFQVERQAVFTAIDVSPHPSSGASAKNLIQVVVDTSGVPDLATFKVLSRENTYLVNDARAAAPKWTFSPATINGRKVCQLVQTPVER